MLLDGKGQGYAIAQNLSAQLSEGCRVVLLSKDQKLRAEGKLKALIATKKAEIGVQRYDVYMENMKRVPYKPESLNRYGVSVI
jgi:hypothetical protein